MTFQDFKNVVGESGQAIAQATGYTREGLYAAFKTRSAKFKRAIFNFLQVKIEEENKRHFKRLAELESLQNEFRPYSAEAAEVTYLDDRRKVSV